VASGLARTPDQDDASALVLTAVEPHDESNGDSSGENVKDFDIEKPFDIREFARTVVGNQRSTLDLESYREAPLSPATIDALRYMRELERSTMSHLRNLLVTPTHKDARVTAFLTNWAFEKFWIADALSAVVEVHGEDPDRGIAHGGKARGVAERIRPIWMSFVAGAIGADLVAAHLAEGTVDEWLTQEAYGRIALLDDNAELGRLIESIVAIKARHLVFFEQESRDRLSDSEHSRTLARRGVARTAWPIGARALTDERTRQFYLEVFADDAVVAELDARIDTLPGLGGLHAIARSKAAAVRGGASGARIGRVIGRAASSIRHRVFG
jgi:hypothetical protein